MSSCAVSDSEEVLLGCFVPLQPSSLRRTTRTPHSSGIARLASEHFILPFQIGVKIRNELSGIPRA